MIINLNLKKWMREKVSCFCDFSDSLFSINIIPHICIKHNCSFLLSDVQKYFNDFASFTNLKSVLCPGRNDLLRGLTSLSLSRMERIPHQVINLNFTLFIRLYDYYNVPSHICNMKQSEMNDTHRCYNFFKLIYCQDTILIDIIKMKNPLEFVFI